MQNKNLPVTIEALIKEFLECRSCKKISQKYHLNYLFLKKLLQESSEEIKNFYIKLKKQRPNVGKYKRTIKIKEKLSKCAKERTGDKNPFYGKKHSKESLIKIGRASKERVGKRNPNYKDGAYKRRPRDYKIHELTKLRNFVFNRDKFTCIYCNQKGNHLHAHHKIPYWVKEDSFNDVDNLVTVCSRCHFEKAHLNNWACFDVKLITDDLIEKYALDRERLNELALLEKSDAKVWTSRINKGEEEDSKKSSPHENESNKKNQA
jgi:hypothetical protein